MGRFEISQKAEGLPETRLGQVRSRGGVPDYGRSDYCPGAVRCQYELPTIPTITGTHPSKIAKGGSAQVVLPTGGAGGYLAGFKKSLISKTLGQSLPVMNRRL
jgi:hypothetical protein